LTAANVKELRVLPGQFATLCFPVHGIIGECNTALGQSVSATANLTSFYSNLGNVTSDPSTLQYNSGAIYNALASTRLMALLGGDAAAAVDKAVANRFNNYWQKYSNTAQAATQIAQINTDTTNDLNSILAGAYTKYTALMQALQAGPMGGVVTEAQSFQTKLLIVVRLDQVLPLPRAVPILVTLITILPRTLVINICRLRSIWKIKYRLIGKRHRCFQSLPTFGVMSWLGLILT
jgi:hypothetical protein